MKIQTSLFRFCTLRRMAAASALMALGSTGLHATILTFEDLTGDNSEFSTVANPFGAGAYASRASSAINAGFQEGDGWTPNVVVSWSVGWHTYTAWPFGNDATTGPGKVAQVDFSASSGNPVDVTFTPDTGYGVLVKSFVFTVYDGSPEIPVQIRWTVYGGSAAPANILASGTSSAIGAAGGAELITTGLTAAHTGATPVILRWERMSGDGTYIALNNLHFTQSTAKIAPQLTWTQPDAIVTGTALSAVQLNALAEVPGTFEYVPPATTVLPAGTHTLTANFTPTDSGTYSNGSITTTLLVKSTNVPVVSVTPPLKIAVGTPLTASLFNAVADVRGSFTYSPTSGTVLPVGSHAVTATFTPDNPAFQNVDTVVTLDVVASIPEGTVWTFEDPANRLRQLCGDDSLAYYDPAATNWNSIKISFGSAEEFSIAPPPGGDSHIMRFAHSLATEGLKLDFNDPPNGGFLDTGRLSNYTLVFDLYYPTASQGVLKPLFNAHPTNANAAEAFVNSGAPNAVQVTSLSYGVIRPDTWHRVALVVRSASAEGQVHIYVDGTFIGAIGSNDTLISSNYSLGQSLLLLTANSGNGGAGYLSGVRFIGRNLDYAEVLALGGPNGAGPHVPGAPGPRPPFQPFRDVLIIGHRGNGGFAPEDTLPSFTSAFATGADVVEIDVRRTADNRVVAMHDSSVIRTTNGTGSVASMTLAQVQALDAGSWFGPQFTGTPPPALREIMAAVKDAWPDGILYLDLKVNGLAPLVKADADATGFPTERIWFWVYDQVAEAAAYRTIFPEAQIIWGEGNWHNGASINSWPQLSSAQKQAVTNGMVARGVYGFDFGDNEMTSLNPLTLQELRAYGFLVSAYSALHPRSMTSAIEHLGVDAMETDFPPVLRSLMPNYVATADAAALSDGAIEVSWPSFPSNPAIDHIKLRSKRKATAPSAWAVVAPALPTDTRLIISSPLQSNTIYEFQPVGYDAANNPVAFGSVTEATTLTAGQNFAAAYQAWQSTHAGVGAPADDSDGDSLSNLLEFAHGFDPLDTTVPAGALPNPTGPFTLRYTRATGRFVTWRCEASSDLETWFPLEPLVECEESIISSQGGYDLIDLAAPAAPGTPQRFLRLRVAPVP